MSRNKTILMICPQGHSFITRQTTGDSFICPNCNQTFADWEGYAFELA